MAIPKGHVLFHQFSEELLNIFTFIVHGRFSYKGIVIGINYRFPLGESVFFIFDEEVVG